MLDLRNLTLGGQYKGEVVFVITIMKKRLINLDKKLPKKYIL